MFCGVGNLIVFDWSLYFVLYNFVFAKQIVETHVVAVSPHIAAFLVTFPVSFMTGFLLSKYVSFQGSPLRGRIQLLRYGMVTGGNVLINYFGLKLLVEQIGLFPTPSKMVVSVICIIFSYLMQRNYTFSGSKTACSKL
jgi:putative flippase GtrA